MIPPAEGFEPSSLVFNEVTELFHHQQTQLDLSIEQ